MRRCGGNIFRTLSALKREYRQRQRQSYLILEAWNGDPHIPDEPPHYFTSAGLLSADELNLVAGIFWRKESDAPGPAEIRQNIRENSALLKKGPVG
jgi:hypothetical protein